MRGAGGTGLVVFMLAVFGALIDTAQAKDLREHDNKVNPHRLAAADLAIIVNDSDPASILTGKYYKDQRHIPEGNIIHIRFTPGNSTMSRTDFERVKREVDSATPDHIQAYVLTWTQPYRVECMSITTAFAAGFDESFCARGCAPTRPSPYFNSNSHKPHDDYGLRPAMMLAGRSFRDVKKLIDRGVASDHTFPRGTGYLVSTSDAARNVRASVYPEIIDRYMQTPFDIRLVKANFIQNRKNVLFYFTGIVRVAALDSISFAPGAIADHLTSAGGYLTGGGDQMSSLRWLEAGATASYGTVSEPCNYPQKFPQPEIVIDRYLHGERLIEAYWKSVAWPGQGVFIGEPLADPFGAGQKISWLRRKPKSEATIVYPNNQHR